MVQDFLMDEHQKLIDTYDPYDPVGEILKKWDPEHNFYWDVDDGTHFPAYQSQFSVRWDSVLE